MKDEEHGNLAAGREAEIRDSFARQTLMTTLGGRITELAAGRCTITAPIGPNARQQHGFGHAGLTFAIGDTAAGYAALTLMPEGSEVLSVELKINLLAPAAGDSIVAEGRVIKAGRRLSVVSAEVFALNGGKRRQIALIQGTMIPVTEP